MLLKNFLLFSVILIYTSGIFVCRAAIDENIFIMDIPIVVTGSRTKQSLVNSPSAVTVITEKYIKNSGASNLSDLLQTAPGIDLFSQNRSNQLIGIRGFISTFSNKILLLVDGKSFYWDTYGMIPWDVMPFTFDEIKQIEIIKGPASSLYGANAFSGVINIITKNPEEINGVNVSITAGNPETQIISANAGAKSGNYQYAGAFQWTQEEERNGDNSGSLTAGKIRIGYDFNEYGKSRFLASRSNYDDKYYYEIGYTSGYSDYFLLEHKLKNLEIVSFLRKNSSNIERGEFISGDCTNIDLTRDISFQHKLGLNKYAQLVWGGNYRIVELKKNIVFPENITQKLWSLFLENNMDISKKFNLITGARYDSHPLTGENLSPRCILMYSMRDNRIFRLSVSKAFRNPTFIETHVQTNAVNTFEFNSNSIPYSYTVLGNEDLESEEIITYEASYQSYYGRGIETLFSVFYNKYHNLISYKNTITYYDANELYPGSPAGVIPKSLLFEAYNSGNAEGIGGELSIKFPLSKRIAGNLDYSYKELTYEADIVEDSPRNTINAGVLINYPENTTITINGIFIDKVTTDYLITTPEIDAYAIANMSINYRPDKKTSVVLGIKNLFDYVHYEYTNSYKMGREITLRLNRTF